MEKRGAMEKGNGTHSCHVLIYPLPLQGNMNSMLSLAELLVYSGHHVTFLLSDHNLNLLNKNPSSLPDLPKFRLLSIPDGLPMEHPRKVDALFSLFVSLATNTKPIFKSLLLELCDKEKDQDGFPPVTCVISDGSMPFAIDASEEVGIPAIAFRAVSACCFWIFYCIPLLIQSGDIPFPDEVDLDEPIKSVPGMENFLRRRDVPIMCRNVKDSADPYLQLMANNAAHSKTARALIFNSSDSLESSSLEHICQNFPNTYAIGPLHEMLKTWPLETNPRVSGKAASLWQEDPTCLTWLDQQPEKSVVYVSFGSLATISRENLIEFWFGLVNSGQRFLWVLRPDLLGEKDWMAGMESLPDEVRRGTKERGCIVNWAPQKDVLAHVAVDCFLTHSGWNSTLESIGEEVRMICWPFFADQQINSRFVGEVWQVGVDMKDVCERNEVEKMVRMAMEGERAQELRKNMNELSKRVKMSIVEGGSSFEDFRRLLHLIESFSGKC